jgi:hypothetical protein
MRIAARWNTTSIPCISSVEQGAIADVPIDDPNRTVFEGPGEILGSAADEVVDHHDLGGSGAYRQVSHVRPDGSRAAGD